MKITFMLLLLIFTFEIHGAKDSISTSKLLQDTSIRSRADTIRLGSEATRVAVRVPEMLIIKESSKAGNPIKDVLPVITLLLGIGINQLLDFVKDRKRITKAGERWIAEIRGLEDPIRQQIELLSKLLEGTPEDKYRYSEPVVISTLDCEIFKSLEKSELLKYISRHKGIDYDAAIKISNRAHGMISILTNLHEQLKDKFKEFQEGTSKHIGDINRNLQLLSRAFANYGAALELELGGSPVGYQRYQPINDLFNKYIEPHREDGAYDLYLLQREFFLPLVKILAHFRHDEKTEDMSLYTVECLNALKGLRMEKRYWRENVTTISEQYSKNLKKLTDTASAIENRKSA